MRKKPIKLNLVQIRQLIKESIATQTMYHGTDQNISVFRLRSNFTTDWRLAASFAFEKQDDNGSKKAWVYEINGDVAEIIRDTPYKQYAFDGVPNRELAATVYYNNVPVKPLRRFEVTREGDGPPYKIKRVQL